MISGVQMLLLGPFAAKVGDGSEVVLPKKAQALLAFLILNRGRRVSREELATLLWSNSGSEQARQSLRQCISVLRRTTGHPSAAWLEVGNEAVTLLVSDALATDIEDLRRLEQSSGREALVRAEELFRGEFVSGLNVSSEPFEDWAAAERERFQTIRLKILARLARLEADEGNLAAAIEAAKRLRDLDPYREESSQILMELLAQSGQRGRALLEHARLQRILREELQIKPASRTQALAESIRRGQLFDVSTTSAANPESAHCSPTPMCRSPADRAAIAVLPFVNLTGNIGEDHRAACVTEDVAADLVRERWPLTVTTPFTAPSAPLFQAVTELANRVDFVVSGSIRQEGARYSALVRLADARTGRHLWTDRIQFDAKTSSALNNELSLRIVSKLAPAIRKLEVGQAEQKPNESLTPYELYLRATALCRKSPEGNTAALKMLRQAITLDPEFGLAYGLAARCFHIQRLMGWSHPIDPALYDGVRLAHRAAELADGDPEALWMAGLAMAVIDGNMEDGRYLVSQSLSISQTNASAWIAGCFVNAHSGNISVAIENFRRAQEVNPDDASQHLQWHAAAMAYFIEGRYEEADLALDAALKQAPNYPGSLRLRIATAGLSGRTDLAHAAARRLLKVNPGSSIASAREYWRPMMAHTPDAVAAQIHGWRRAGMDEG